MGKIYEVFKSNKGVVLGAIVVAGLKLAWEGYLYYLVKTSSVAESRAEDIVLLPNNNNTDYTEELCNSVKERRPFNNGEPFLNRGGKRNLPDGWHASESHIQMAKENGIELGEHQTFVPPHMKNCLAQNSNN